MEKGQIMIICGEGKGKTSAAIGRGISGASKGKSVIIIRFLKGKVKEKDEFIKRLEPEIKVFSFEKWDVDYESLSPEQQQEEAVNIRNGMNFARKVMTTDGCDLLILDEVLGLVDREIITEEELKALVETKDESMELVLTGINMCESLYPYADDVVKIDTLK
ncbi:MAG: cob(I)yrinic acid a,c-diamide adenosyltransferase [Lachnospiraceae bacterium]|jgi:cob(I)alamin adenosyltransferase|nr:cob(I)yrinic acid a,c-diamide adenosyltransferase [Lachnospiraceae bacterium]